MGDGTKENPYTRKDVERLIEERGGTAIRLDLSNKIFVEAIDLSGLDLQGIILNSVGLFRANFNGSDLDGANMQKAYLGYATFNPLKSEVTHLQGTDLRNTNLHDAEFREADLKGAQFQGEPGQLLPASLDRTDFRNANLFRANFKGCYLYGTKLEGAYTRGADILEAHLEEADWGNYKSGEENNKDYYPAEHRYRELKVWYKQSGYDDIAAKFYYREREAGRKGAQRRRDHVSGWLAWAFFGHGEGWKRILFWIAGFVLFFALIYFAIGTLTPNTFLNSLYYSAVSFTALGYGQWAPQPTGWVKGLGAFEALVGVFMMALLLVTFVRKWTR